MTETCSFILVIFGACFVWVMYMFKTAPEGEQIPGVGFVETKKRDDK